MNSLRHLFKSIVVMCALFSLALSGGCGNNDREETDRLLNRAATRIEELENQLEAERKAYSNNYAVLAKRFKEDQKKNNRQIEELNSKIDAMQKEIENLRKTAKSMKAYSTLLQQRLDTIKEMRDARE